MLLPLAILALALGQAQATPEEDQRPQPEDDASRSRPPAGSPEAARPGSVEIDGAGQTGIPFLPSVPASTQRDGTVVDLAVVSLLRTQTLGEVAGSTTWGTDVEVTPGIGLRSQSPTLDVAGGYGARLTFPLNATGATFAALQRAYVRLDWMIDPMWTASLDVSGTYGQYSQLSPITTPGGPGAPPPALNPVRSFSTYPYLAASGGVAVEAKLSARARLRILASYVDVGGIGDEGAAAQPRTWGPQASTAFEWVASPLALLTTTLAYQDSILVEGLAIQIGTLTEGWRQRWTPDLETLVSAGVALTSSESATFIAFGHVLPVASAGVAYHVDARHTFRVGLDVALAPYVDAYQRTAYQRLTGRFGLDWLPDPSVVASVYLAGALVPYSVGVPDVFGTAGASVGWAPGRIFTFSLGAFTQSQIQGSAAATSTYRQWSGYLSVGARESI